MPTLHKRSFPSAVAADAFIEGVRLTCDETVHIVAQCTHNDSHIVILEDFDGDDTICADSRVIIEVAEESGLSLGQMVQALFGSYEKMVISAVENRRSYDVLSAVMNAANQENKNVNAS